MSEPAEPSSGSPDARLHRGDVAGQRWRLEEFMKSGGMGRVWRATDLRLGEPVAIKLMDPGLVATEAARARFLREAQTAARLRGPNVVQILDSNVDEATQVPYIAMELLRGEDLAERIARGPLSLDETVAVLGDVCAAIGRAHRMNIVHRDLKPANIFLIDDEDGPLCKVLDFGIVKLRELGGPRADAPQTGAGATLGTVVYMSPEQIADAQQVDARADLWSLGVIAYECVTGRRPFRGATYPELVHAICYGDPVPPSRLADVPGGFDAWFARATHRDLGRRFATARELHEELRELAGQRAEAASPRRSMPPRDVVHTQSWASDANQIDIGALGALTFKNAVVREFLDEGGKHFVTGGKGLGKTLLLTYKRSILSDHYLPQSGREKQRHAAVQFIPEGRPYLDLMGDLPTIDQTWLDLLSKLHECKRLWSFALRMSIASYHPALFADGDPRDLEPLPRRLRGLLEGRPVEPTMVLKEALSLTVRQINQVIDAMEGTLERRIRSLHSGVFVFIDKLDQALRRLPRAVWVHMQAGLIEAAWDLMNANRHVKIYATIREEAFSSYESDIKTNLFGAISTIRYAKHELFDLLEKLTHYYEGLSLRDFILLDVVNSGRSARAEGPFDFLYRHTLGRPRDLVILASEISRHRRSLDERTFARLVQDTSAGLLVANVFDEMRVFLEVLSDRDKRAHFLSLIPRDVLTREDVIEIWCAFHGVDRAYYDAHGKSDDVYHPFRELFECGLLGVVAKDPAGDREIQRFRQPHDALFGARHDLPRSRHYLLHPALRAMLEPLPGDGRFRAVRHVVLGHGEPWPRHWDLVVDVQRELHRRPDADPALVTMGPQAAPNPGPADPALTDAVLAAIDRLAAEVAAGKAADVARRAVASSPDFARLSADLDRAGWDELHLLLLDLFPGGRAGEPEPTNRAQAAMLLVDIVRSTRMVQDLGDTGFVDHLQKLRERLRGTAGLRFVKGTGDGYLTVHDTVAGALAAARALRDAVDDPARLRLVIHWGPVRMSAEDVHGSEVHRLFRIEAIEEGDRADGPASWPALPLGGRVAMSQAARDALPGAARAGFRRAGAFRLKGFDEPEPIWVEMVD